MIPYSLVSKNTGSLSSALGFANDLDGAGDQGPANQEPVVMRLCLLVCFPNIVFVPLNLMPQTTFH